MFNKRIKIKELYQNPPLQQTITVMGWIRTFRNNQFIALNDGSTNNNLQVVAALGLLDEATLKRLTTGASIKATGTLVESLGKGQTVELQAQTIEILGDSDAEKFPLQPKKHSLEFLREKAHLRFKTKTFGSVFRIRHSLAFAVHEFFHKKGFLYLHTPIITSSDAEGAGEMFRVTTLPFDNPPRNEDGSVNYKEDFFGKSTNLTVSGQLKAMAPNSPSS
ncbi:MAG: OB-fold nucleic acid binding domain-containing protein [Chitinophagaceae bacterium]